MSRHDLRFVVVAAAALAVVWLAICIMFDPRTATACIIALIPSYLILALIAAWQERH